ncbi:unnamed protein product [Strongylus vulgaris]|uniref:Uncharacterized protein n=1 Tax=Strongylus vulgaris TaxID=40348 RepID=A0A3P7J6F1_STRVU|nr:unnamed protein product [Strongylus vulgaris]
MLVLNCDCDVREVQIHYSLPAENSACPSVQRTCQAICQWPPSRTFCLARNQFQKTYSVNREDETLISYLNYEARREVECVVVLQKTSFQRVVRSAFDVITVSDPVSAAHRAHGGRHWTVVPIRLVMLSAEHDSREGDRGTSLDFFFPVLLLEVSIACTFEDLSAKLLQLVLAQSFEM